MSVKSDVLAVMEPDTGMSPSAIQAFIGRWSATSVRHALRELCDEGVVTFTGTDCHRLYRLAVPGKSA